MVVAQLGELLYPIPEVRGSNPATGIIDTKHVLLFPVEKT